MGAGTGDGRHRRLLRSVAAGQIYARLSALGGRFTFGPNGILSIPYRSSTATVGGAFVAQGGNIPVKKASFGAITLTPKKVG